MSVDPLPVAGGLAYREAGPADAPAVLCVHGWPESSWMWRHALEALSAAGLRAIAPDLPGSGASAVRRPATWALHREALEGFRQALGLERVALAVHDWGGLIGLRWACDHPDAIAALAISDTGFFPDGKWHGLAQIMRTEGQGEDFMKTLDREAFGAVLQGASKGMTAADLDEYFQALATEDGRLAALDMYRSGEFSELAPYEGKLAALGVPTLILWGEDDPFAPIAGAQRLLREIPHARLEVVPGTGHFVADDAPEEFAGALAGFFTEALA
jgi:haloalkane dehalogenase